MMQALGSDRCSVEHSVMGIQTAHKCVAGVCSAACGVPATPSRHWQAATTSHMPAAPRLCVPFVMLERRRGAHAAVGVVGSAHNPVRGSPAVLQKHRRRGRPTLSAVSERPSLFIRGRCALRLAVWCAPPMGANEPQSARSLALKQSEPLRMGFTPRKPKGGLHTPLRGCS